MKKLILLLALPIAAQAQSNAVYFELGGNAVVPSINYERRVNERLFGRIGASYVVGETETDTDHTFIVPLTLSWVSHPTSSHHFEAGGGLTIAGGDRQDLFDNDDDEEKFSTVFATGIIGYRFQKASGGFQFRAAITPLIATGEFLPWAGISFGYSW